MIIGHQKILNYFHKSLEKDSLNHAYLFSGPEHVGKFTVALDFAQKILGDTREINPDLILIKPEIEEKKGITRKKTIDVETIREAQRKAATTSFYGKHKIIIIDEADYLNISSQNALLKTLEEPSQNVIILLIVSDQKKLLPTVISRCQVYKFNLVSDLEIAQGLDFEKNEEDILFWSLGRPGLAIRYKNDKTELESAEQDRKDLEKIISSSLVDKFFIAEQWSKDTLILARKLSLWMVLLRHAVISEDNFLPLSKVKSFAYLNNFEKALETIKNTNSNPRLILEQVLLEIN